MWEEDKMNVLVRPDLIANFIRTLIRGIPVKRNSYQQLVDYLSNYLVQNRVF